MDNLSDLLSEYIKTKFTSELALHILTSFKIFSDFELKFYEDSYVDIISAEEDLNSDDVQDLFIVKTKSLLVNILNDHLIHLNDIDGSLEELNQLCQFLLLMQKLEDTYYVSYRIFNTTTNKNKLVDLIERYTLLERFRIMELISHVEDRFMLALEQLVSDKELTYKQIDKLHLKEWNYFISFINNTDCLGKKYKELGYFNIDFESFISLMNIDLLDKTEKEININHAQLALDIVSILFLCSDTYELPLLNFKKLNPLFCNNIDQVSRLDVTITNMLNDYYSFKQAKEQSEQLNTEEVQNG